RLLKQEPRSQIAGIASKALPPGRPRAKIGGRIGGRIAGQVAWRRSACRGAHDRRIRRDGGALEIDVGRREWGTARGRSRVDPTRPQYRGRDKTGPSRHLARSPHRREQLAPPAAAFPAATRPVPPVAAITVATLVASLVAAPVT